MIAQRGHMILRKPRTLAVLALWASALFVSAAPAQELSVEGTWQGTLSPALGIDLRIVFHIDEGEDGLLRATMDSPDQAAVGIAVDEVETVGDSLELRLARLEAGYRGLRVAADTIRGEWSQMGQAHPLDLVRTEGVDLVARRPQEPAQPVPYRVEEVRYLNSGAGIWLAGTLTIPDGPGPFPAVALISGSGPQDRDGTIMSHRPFLVIADHLSRYGVAVLRSDERGVGRSEGDYWSATLEDLTQDAAAAVAFLHDHPDVDPHRVGLIGHSQGGLVAPRVVVDHGGVAFVVLLAAPGLPAEEILLTQEEAIARTLGATETQVESALELRRAMIRVVRSVDSEERRRQELHSVIREQLGALPPGALPFGVPATGQDQWIASQVSAFGTPAFRSIVVSSPEGYLQNVRVPVLGLFGELDLQVSPAENLAAIRRALSDAGNPDVTLESLPQLNHLFQTADTGLPTEYSQIAETFAVDALEAVAAWIRERWGANLDARPPLAGDTGVTIEDAIRMVRIEDRFGTDSQFAAISPDGSKVATVVWQGDLERNVNVFSLLFLDVEEARVRPASAAGAVLAVPFDGDHQNEFARPIEALAILPDNRTVTYIGYVDGGPRQVYALDVVTGESRALTEHPSDVIGYALAPDGSVRLYHAEALDEAGAARMRRIDRDGVWPYDRESFPEGHAFAAFATVNKALEAGSVGTFHEPEGKEGAGARLVFDPRDPTDSPETLRDLLRYLAEDVIMRGRMPAAPRPNLSRAKLERERSAGTGAGLNPWRPIVTAGTVAVGITESPSTPPELAALDLGTGELSALTDLNPELRTRRHGEVEEIRFSTPYDSVATAWLVKPIGFNSGRSYPLVVLHSNVGERAGDPSYLIDGRLNLAGHAAQPLAAHGFLVLFIGAPARKIGGPGEARAMQANIEEAIRSLASGGFVDTLRVGVSGFSRSAFFTEYLLMYSDFPFAAASQIDGGTAAYLEGMRPYTDDELRRVRTPLLAQAHGPIQLAYQGRMLDRLRALGRPADLLYFATAPHSTRQPLHRWRSLNAHVDWWRFWLQGIEDPSPEKVSQYRRWRSIARGSPRASELETIPEPIDR